MTLFEFINHLKSKLQLKSKDDFLFYDCCGEIVERELGDPDLQQPGVLKILIENEADVIKLIKQRNWSEIKRRKTGVWREGLQIFDNSEYPRMDEFPGDTLWFQVSRKLIGTRFEYDADILAFFHKYPILEVELDRLWGKGASKIYELMLRYRPSKDLTVKELSKMSGLSVATTKRRVGSIQRGEVDILRIIKAVIFIWLPDLGKNDPSVSQFGI